MKTIKSLMGSRVGGTTARPQSLKTRGRRVPACEALEGRQLLNGSWGWPGAAGAASAPGSPTADVHYVPKAGAHAFSPPKLSAAAQADLKVLQADRQKLQAEIKADPTVTAAAATLKADMAPIEKALATILPKIDGSHRAAAGDKAAARGFLKAGDPSIDPNFTGRPGPKGPGGPGFGPGGPDMGSGKTLPAALVTKLESAGVTADQIAKLEADKVTLRATIKAVDPTLQTQVRTDLDRFKKDAPAPPTPAAGVHAHFDHVLNMKTTDPTATTTAATTG